MIIGCHGLNLQGKAIFVYDNSKYKDYCKEDKLVKWTISKKQISKKEIATYTDFQLWIFSKF